MTIRERLKRLGAVGLRSHPSPRQDGAAPPPAAGRPWTGAGPAGDGVEVLRTRYAPGHRHGRCVLREAFAILADCDDGDIERTVWLDTETTGLAGGTGTCAFLIGAAHVEDGALVLEQFLLHRLSAEGRLLAAVRERLGRARHLVTFNGRRFDWPILEARFILARQQPVAVETHTDLIHPARRLWHRVLGTHRLSVLEAEILGAPRADDVAGWEIPMIYVQYLRTADRTALNPVLAHNRADLMALVALHGEVTRILRNPPGAGVPLDWEGAGALLGRGGDHRGAAACFERAAQEAVAPRDRWRVLRRLTRQYRALGDDRRVHAVWEAELGTWTGRDLFRVQVLEEAAKCRSRRGDPEGARTAITEGLRIAFSPGGGAFETEGALRRLIERLTRRLSRFVMGRDERKAPRFFRGEDV